MSPSASSIPKIYFGTMTFGWKSQTSSFVDLEVANRMVEQFIAFNARNGIRQHRVDTARIYAAEDMVGQCLKAKQRDVLLGTKAHPQPKGGLSKQGIHNQYQQSLSALAFDEPFEEYYLHQPDTQHSLLESLETLHGLVQKKKIRRVGMSNYHASEVQRALNLCAEQKLTPPTVYQGLYNPLNRAVENELLPLLRSNGISFVAYNPLAAGLLAGKHVTNDPKEVPQGRFKNNPNYLPRFYTPANFKAIDLIRQACESEKLSMVEATYRWLLRHSALTGNDGILLGASSGKERGSALFPAVCYTSFV